MKKLFLCIVWLVVSNGWIIRNRLVSHVMNDIQHSLHSSLTSKDKLHIGFDSRPERIIPFLFIFFAHLSNANASPLNPQCVHVRSPFFQGWLVRGVDHKHRSSFISIIGSFSEANTNNYTQHYVFCGIQKGDQCWQAEIFPDPASVNVSGSQPSASSSFSSLKDVDVTWKASNIGSFKFTEESCQINFNFGGIYLQCETSSRIPWKDSSKGVHTDGPEGWLGYTSLLPCHYYVHSTGSTGAYSFTCPDGTCCSGQALHHIEGNHGLFFPEGWVWCQAVSADNDASMSFVGGKFVIGPVTQMNFIVYLRYDNKIRIFRTTDMDSIEHFISFLTGRVKIRASSLLGSDRVEIEVKAKGGDQGCFGHPIHIPTSLGFSNKPGCRETYTAQATVTIVQNSSSFGEALKTLHFDQVALEFGATFQHGQYANMKD